MRHPAEDFEATPDLLGQLRFERYLGQMDHYQRPAGPKSADDPMTEAQIAHMAAWLRELHALEDSE